LAGILRNYRLAQNQY